jgi:hypothetical protein
VVDRQHDAALARELLERLDLVRAQHHRLLDQRMPPAVEALRG